MIFIRAKTGAIQPILNSLQRTFSEHQRHIESQQNLSLPKRNWQLIGSITSISIFFFLLIVTIILIPTLLIHIQKGQMCSITKPTSTFPTSTLSENQTRLCAANASWNPRGITVAGLTNGSSSIALSGLHHPSDIYVYPNGTILIVDSANQRITKWYPNGSSGILIAGTGYYGSWKNLLAGPIAFAIRNDKMFVSDVENYRIQIFDMNSNISSPNAVTLIGQYGEGSNLNQINDVTRLIAPVSFPSLLYIADTKNHRVLRWNIDHMNATIIADETNSQQPDSTYLFSPIGIALDERTNSLFIVDTANNRVQKYDMNQPSLPVTVAGWGQINHAQGIELDPSGSHLFIADTQNHRILLWLHGDLHGRIIAGNGTAGNNEYQLSSPAQIRLDSSCNLYVVDTENNRIQRFDLISNGC